MIGSSNIKEMIHTFFLACVGSYWFVGEFGIVSVTYGILKYSSYNKLKPTSYPEGGNSISSVIIVVLMNGVDLRSSSHGIKLRRSELWIRL